MNTFKKLRTVAAFVLVLSSPVFLTGCSHSGGIASVAEATGMTGAGTPYSIGDCRIAPFGSNEGANLYTTVRGPAADIAIIITSPKGDSHSKIIRKEEMITNSKDFSILMAMEYPPQTGEWIVTVKTIKPEMVVFKRTVMVSQEKVAQN